MTLWEDNQFIIMLALDHIVSVLTGACVQEHVCIFLVLACFTDVVKIYFTILNSIFFFFFNVTSLEESDSFVDRVVRMRVLPPALYADIVDGMRVFPRDPRSH